MYTLGEGSGSLEGVVGDVSLILRDFFPKNKILKNLNSVSLCAGSSIVTVIFWGDQPNGVSLEIPCYVPFLRTGWNLSRSHPNSKIPVDDGRFRHPQLRHRFRSKNETTMHPVHDLEQ